MVPACPQPVEGSGLLKASKVNRESGEESGRCSNTKWWPKDSEDNRVPGPILKPCASGCPGRAGLHGEQTWLTSAWTSPHSKEGSKLSALTHKACNHLALPVRLTPGSLRVSRPGQLSPSGSDVTPTKWRCPNHLT